MTVRTKSIQNPASKEPSQGRRWVSIDLLIIGGLLFLSLVPSIGGSVRLFQLASGAEITPENARFFAAPIPVVLHIISVTLYAVLGAFQFAPAFRRRRFGWHRWAGRLLIPAGLVVALTGLWMAQFYPWPELDGYAIYAMRLVVGMAMLYGLIIGWRTIQQGDYATHAAWMIRAYALAMGAGTQVFTHLPLLFLPDALNETTRALAMGGGWLINWLIAEWVIIRFIK